MKKNGWIVVTLLCVVLGIGLVVARPYLFAASRCEGTGFTLPQDALITVQHYENGEIAHDYGLRLDDPDVTAEDYAAVAGYLEAAYCDAVRLTLVSHAPRILIQADGVQVNIQDDLVIVSIRTDANSTWEPGVRPRTDGDDRMVDWLLKLARHEVE